MVVQSVAHDRPTDFSLPTGDGRCERVCGLWVYIKKSFTHCKLRPCHWCAWVSFGKLRWAASINKRQWMCECHQKLEELATRFAGLRSTKLRQKEGRRKVRQGTSLVCLIWFSSSGALCPLQATSAHLSSPAPALLNVSPCGIIIKITYIKLYIPVNEKREKVNDALVL